MEFLVVNLFLIDYQYQNSQHSVERGSNIFLRTNKRKDGRTDGRTDGRSRFLYPQLKGKKQYFCRAYQKCPKTELIWH